MCRLLSRVQGGARQIPRRFRSGLLGATPVDSRSPAGHYDPWEAPVSNSASLHFVLYVRCYLA